MCSLVFPWAFGVPLPGVKRVFGTLTIFQLFGVYCKLPFVIQHPIIQSCVRLRSIKWGVKGVFGTLTKLRLLDLALACASCVLC